LLSTVVPTHSARLSIGHRRHHAWLKSTSIAARRALPTGAIRTVARRSDRRDGQFGDEPIRGQSVSSQTGRRRGEMLTENVAEKWELDDRAECDFEQICSQRVDQDAG